MQLSSYKSMCMVNHRSIISSQSIDLDLTYNHLVFPVLIIMRGIELVHVISRGL